MMQQTHLTAWQAHAPWPKRSQIEQDLRLSRGVAAIFDDAVLREHLAMRGGTVLHKAHLAPAARYSEDIDLVLVKSMDTDTLDGHLRRVLTPVLGRPSDSLIADAWLAIRNVLRHPDVSYVLVYDTEGRVIHDGSADIATYGQTMSDPFAFELLSIGDVHVQSNDDLTDIAAPIRIGKSTSPPSPKVKASGGEPVKRSSGEAFSTRAP